MGEGNVHDIGVIMSDSRRAAYKHDKLYIPVCNTWQKETCASLGLTVIHGNHSHVQQPIMINVSQQQIELQLMETAFLNRSISLVTGS